MQTINRMMTNISSEDLPASRDFYSQMLDLDVDYDSDWFVHLISKEKKLELGIIKRDHEICPAESNGKPAGFFVTFVVDDVDAAYRQAQGLKLEVVAVPEDTPYGQRRMLLRDPNGIIVDLSSPMKDFSG